MSKDAENKMSYAQRCLIEDLVKGSLTPLIEAVLVKRLLQMAEFIKGELDAKTSPPDHGPLLLRAYEAVHHDPECPSIGGNGDKDCQCDAVPFLRDLRAALSQPATQQGELK